LEDDVEVYLLIGVGSAQTKLLTFFTISTTLH